MRVAEPATFCRAPEVWREMGLTDAEYQRIVELMGREPTDVELGMFAVMWSEHCGYKYSRPVLSLFQRYRESLEGAGFENAGVVPLDEHLGIAFKVESHNHPSAVEPHQGAATGVGGIIRDIFTMGARPIAILDSLRFGSLNEPRNRYLFEHVVEGISSYGNCIGVPTVAGEVYFHPCYSGNPLVNAMAVGVVPLNRVITARADVPGSAVMYVGASTGRDGIHGATFASETLGEDQEQKRPNVQIGDPFMEKLLIEATLEAVETGAVLGMQDMGAAGLTCTTCEPTAKSGTGVEIDTSLVPMREANMTPYEIMLSESQERMLLYVQAGREAEVAQVFRKWGLNAVVIGRVIQEPVLRVRHRGEVVAEIPPDLLTKQCPVYYLKTEEPEYLQAAQHLDLAQVPIPDDMNTVLLQLLATPTIASKRWVYEQYDWLVGTQTIVPPGEGDAAALRIRGSEKGIALKIDGNARYCYLHPYRGGQIAVVEAARNVACVGAMPRALTDCLNFGNPQRPEIFYQFEQVVRGIAEASEFLGTPVVSGNVSFYNESERGAVYPTPTVGMLGILERAENAVGMGFKQAGDVVLLVCPPAPSPTQWESETPLARVAGEGQGVRADTPLARVAGEGRGVRADTHFGLGASEYLYVIHGLEQGMPAPVDLAAERRLHRLLVELANRRLVQSMHDLSEGGFAVALAECALVYGIGACVDLPAEATAFAPRPDAALFGETHTRVILSAKPENAELIRQLAATHGLACYILGSTGGDRLRIALQGQIVVDLTWLQCREAYEGAIQLSL
ncbi:MAG: phosphoribosylformylglycinamidine synthase subunit PurL [Fimbriimonadales bacterium]|nr:phosphoribosylformylglycinamidine synthase subunit PurL [Fimbriimonadales bacterium]